VPLTDSCSALKLQDLGYVEGKNLRLDLKRAEGDYARLPTLAVELVSLAPDVIVATSSPATAALQRATSSIPIVMAAINDPIGLGFVKSLAKPGGNITGLSNLSADFTAKSFELLHVAIPNAKRIAVLMSPNPLHEAVVKEAYTVAGAMGLTIVPVMARTPADLDAAFATMHKESCDALVVLSDPRTSRKIVELANEWRLPAIYQATGFADMGGLLTYSANFPEMFVAHLLARTIRVEEDLVDQLFNSSEKRLARALLLLANFGKEGRPEPIITKVSQETLAEMIGTTRSRVSHFMTIGFH
jgi:ABC-type uncharacterized transport system substrate-binding protein